MNAPTMTTVTPAQLLGALRAARAANIPLMIEGSPGIGKTALVRQFAADAGAECMIIYPPSLDPTDLGGLPVPVGGTRVKRLIDDRLLALCDATEPTVVLLDEFGQAPHAVQASCAPLLLARELNGKPLSPHVYVCAATNRRTDRAGAHSVLSHLVSRVITVGLTVAIEEWADWAVTARLASALVAFLRLRPTLLHVFDTATADGNTMSAYPCPRAWERVSDVLAQNPAADVLAAMVGGTVGEGAATECLAYLRTASKVRLADFLDDPKGAKVPKSLEERYALAVGLAYHTKAETADTILTVAERLLDIVPELAALLTRDAFHVFPQLGGHAAWLKRANGRLQHVLVSA